MEKQAIIDKLFAVGAHYGLVTSRRHPSVSGFIFGSKGGTELFDLEQTAGCLSKALQCIAECAAARKTILFVGGKAEAREALRRAAERIGQPYVASRWIGGTLTNFNEIKKRLARLSEISEMNERGELAKFTKHERLLIEREAQDLERMFGGLKSMQKLPDTLFVIDSKHESGAVAEARQLGIPVVALLNSDCNTSQIDYSIPANDASIATITYILDEVTKIYIDNLAVSSPSPLAPEGSRS